MSFFILLRFIKTAMAQLNLTSMLTCLCRALKKDIEHAVSGREHILLYEGDFFNNRSGRPDQTWKARDTRSR